MINPRPLGVALAILPALLLPACALQQDHKRMARAFLNGRTADEALAPAATDFEIWFGDTTTPPVSREQFREMIQWDATLNADAEIHSIHARGESAVAVFHEDNDFSRLLGHPGWDATMTFWFDQDQHGGLITSALYQPHPDNEPIEPYLDRALPYLREHHAEQLAAFYPNDTLVTTPESARAWRRMLTDWRQSIDSPAGADTTAQ